MKPVALACLAVLLLTACSDQQPLQPPAGSRPSALIMDGAHHGGNPDFFFLPPLAADPTGGPNFDPGKFNPNLSPTAEVCTLTGDPGAGAVDCATDTQGRPVLVFGPTAMSLSVEQYQVTWDTKSPVLLDASKFYRIIVRGAPRGTMLGLLDVDPVTGGIKNVKTGEVVQFQDGRTLPIKVRIEQGAFGVTNPDHVEQVVTNHITTPTGTVDVTTNTGFAGARLVDNWLPAAAVAAGIDRVVVIIERVPVNNEVLATSCLKSGFKELEGCYRFRTDPDLHQYGSFNTTVIAGVCFEQPIHSDAPYEMFRREETGEQELVHLDDSDAPFLNCATFSPTPTTVSVSPGAGPGRLLALASAGLRMLVGRVGWALTPRTLHAVDLGAGGRTNAFSFFGWARRATLTKAAPSDNQVTLVGTKVLTDPMVCLATLHPSTRPLVGEPVTFTVSGGGGTVGGGASVPRVTGSDGCASAPWVLGSATALAGNRLTAAAAASPGTVEFVATGVSVEVDAAEAHSCALKVLGQAYCWGANFSGEVGDGGAPGNRLVPTPVAGGLTFAALSAGGLSTCGVTASGAAYCWGLNNNGQLGDGTTTTRLVPTAVAGGRTFAALSAGGANTCGVTTSGAAYCWGRNDFGQLGDGTTTERLVPTPVAGGLTFATLSAGTFHTCGVTPSGAAYCWGVNTVGQLGDGTQSDRFVPTPVAGGLAFAALSVGLNHTCGVTTNGMAYCWGLNGTGQVGDGTTTDRLAPTAVIGGLTFAALSAGSGQTCGATTSGAAYCWGFNNNGQLGDGTTTQRLVPTPVAGGLTFATLSAGTFHTCGATTSGVAYCWGFNSTGQMGDGTTTDRHVPTEVVFTTGPDIAIAGGTYTDRTGGLIGTAFLYDPTDPAGPINSVAIAGPAGWNAGAGLTIFRYQPPGIATTRAVWWVFNPAIATSGTYTATATIGGVVRRATFSIDATSALEAPQITSVDPGTSQVAITWTDSPSPQAFLVAVVPVPFGGFYAAARVVSGDTRTLTFSGLSLVPGGSYQAVVWAYDKDVITPGAIGSQFNIGAQAVTFTTPSAIP